MVDSGLNITNQQSLSWASWLHLSYSLIFHESFLQSGSAHSLLELLAFPKTDCILSSFKTSSVVLCSISKFFFFFLVFLRTFTSTIVILGLSSSVSVQVSLRHSGVSIAGVLHIRSLVCFWTPNILALDW